MGRVLIHSSLVRSNFTVETRYLAYPLSRGLLQKPYITKPFSETSVAHSSTLTLQCLHRYQRQAPFGCCSAVREYCSHRVSVDNFNTVEWRSCVLPVLNDRIGSISPIHTHHAIACFRAVSGQTRTCCVQEEICRSGFPESIEL